MHLETPCGKCHGTGIYPTPAREDYFAHEFKMTCSCEQGDLSRRQSREMFGHAQERWGGNQHELILARAANIVAWVDRLIAGEVEALWSHGVATSGSCQAANDGMAMISLKYAHQGKYAAALIGWDLDPEAHFNDSRWLRSAARHA